jgi:acetyl esterase/lipase
VVTRVFSRNCGAACPAICGGLLVHDHGYVRRVTPATSLRAKLFVAQLRLTRTKRTFADLRKLHESFEHRQRPQDGTPPASLLRRLEVTDHDVRGQPCYTLRPRDRLPDRHVLYPHGGAYVHQIQPDHWSLLARLVERTGAAVTAPLYPLAPTYHHDDTIPMVRACYDELLAGVEPEQQVIMGTRRAAGCRWCSRGHCATRAGRGPRTSCSSRRGWTSR